MVLAGVEVLEEGSLSIFVNSAPKPSENVVASDLVQQLKETRLALQHQELSSSSSQSRIASLPAAVPSNVCQYGTRYEKECDLLTVSAHIRTVWIIPALIGACVALVVLFLLQVA